MLALVSLFIVVSAATTSTADANKDLASTLSDFNDLYFGFLLGLQNDPSLENSNPCINQTRATESLKQALPSSLSKIIKGPSYLFSFIDAYRQYTDAKNLEYDLCKLPTLIATISSAFSLSNSGEYVIKYIVNASTYNGYIDSAKKAYSQGDFQTAGENIGLIFKGLTNFYI